MTMIPCEGPISAAARAVVHGLAVAARAKTERQGGGWLNEARRLDDRTQAIAAVGSRNGRATTKPEPGVGRD